MLAIFICVAVLLFSPTFGAPKGGQLIAPRDCQFTIPYNDSSGSSSSTSSGFSSGSSSILDSLGSVSVGGSSGSLGSLGSSTGFSSTRGSSGAGGAPNRRQASSSSAPVADPLEIGFAIPSGTANSGKGPCSLVLDLTSPDAKLTGASLPATVNVVALDGPSSGSVIGTVQFAAGAKATVNTV
ncbi:hypothetical protein N0V88_000620 [Collariella sp. IMI 366227]|nr:hypothetical protein N0V88_000620 [Collariella sp. IMI 366227]